MCGKVIIFPLEIIFDTFYKTLLYKPYQMKTCMYEDFVAVGRQPKQN